MINLCASDLDGTLLRSDGTYNHEDFAWTLAKLAQRNGQFVIATANGYPHTSQLFSEMVTAPNLTFILEDGALTTTPTGRILASQPMPWTTWQRVLNWVAQQSTARPYIILSGEKGAYTNLTATSDRFQASAVFYPNLRSVASLFGVKDRIYKLDLSWDDQVPVDVEACLNQVAPQQFQAVSAGLGGLDVVAQGVSKARALQDLMRDWPAIQETVAFGDSMNDLALLATVDDGYAMINADPRLKQVTQRTTTATNDQDGVFQTLKHLL